MCCNYKIKIELIKKFLEVAKIENKTGEIVDMGKEMCSGDYVRWLGALTGWLMVEQGCVGGGARMVDGGARMCWV